ncbi:MAG TPA: FkbM family methyltransferase [Gammaproteobacteria bacterium]|nr:FkbM family methyltransferase [Gammaproteobacteria bacterium]
MQSIRMNGENGYLPRENLRDYLNELRLDLKFRYPPWRAYYRYRAHKYLTRIDPEMGILKFLVDPRRASLDIGANLGLFTYFLARLCPKVYAFEPNPFPLRLLRYVADPNVEVAPTAITDRTGDVELVIPKGRKGWSSNGASLEDHCSGRTIRVTAPGARLDDLHLPPAGFIKIDVEGHELAVLRGALATLARDRPNIYIENEHAHAGDSAVAVFQLLAGLGYQGFFFEDGVLRTLSHFDVEKHQLQPAAGAGDRRYVRNFVFLPS